MLFIFTDGQWNSGRWAHDIIDEMNRKGVMTILIFMGGTPALRKNLEETRNHHCKIGMVVHNVTELLPAMKQKFFDEFRRSTIKSLRKYY